MEPLKLALSIIIVISVFVLLRAALHFWMKAQIARWSRLNNGEKEIRRQDVDLQVFAHKQMIHGAVRNQGYTVWGRLILTDQRLLVVSHKGIILEISAEQKGEAKALGPERLVLLGASPNGLSARIELILEEEAEWAKAINLIAQEK